MKKKQFVVLVIFVVVFVGLIALVIGLEGPRQKNSKVQVTASFYPVAEFARQVGGDKVVIKTLVKPGVEPHDYDPKPQDLTTLYRSKLFVYNGGGLEPWVNRIQDEASKNNVVIVNASSSIPLLSAAEDEHGEADAHEEGAYDPHVWTDPVLAQTEVQNIANGLVQADPANKEYYETRAKDYIAKLAALDAQFKQGLGNCARHDIVTSHQAFQYLGKRYNIEVETISGLSPQDEPSPQELAKVAEFAKAHKVQYIFFETLVSPKLADTLAKEIGAKTLVFNPIEGLSDDEVGQGKDYLVVQKENLQNLRVALDCK